MAVFTVVDLDEARALTARLGAGNLLSLDGIGAGIENTNYFAHTDRGRWVLTLFERLSAEQLPFYLGLMQHLARHGLPVPEPLADASGALVHWVAGKPAALVHALAGHHPPAPGIDHCAQLGQMLAHMHLAVADFPLQQPNLRGLPWCLQTAPLVLPYLAPDQQSLLRTELLHQQSVAASAAYLGLPRGAVHADMFCDNVLFDGGEPARLSGCLDFYFAGIDTFAYDLAVCLNEWCIAPASGQIEASRSHALITAYESVRSLRADERRLMPSLLRAAALRFWLSRLGDWHLPRAADLLQAKDPLHFERILRERIRHPWQPGNLTP